MFNEKDKKMDKINTLIGEQCLITGTLRGTGIIKIDGNQEGDIVWEDDILIGPSAYCNGNITCKNAFVNGKVKGNILCENTITIGSYGKIIGDVTMKNLIIREGAYLQGKCTMIIEQKESDLIK